MPRSLFLRELLGVDVAAVTPSSLQQRNGSGTDPRPFSSPVPGVSRWCGGPEGWGRWGEAGEPHRERQGRTEAAADPGWVSVAGDPPCLGGFYPEVVGCWSSREVGSQEPEQSRALTKPAPEERGSEAGGGGGPGGASLPHGFCLISVLNTNRFKVWFEQLVCLVGKG